MKLTAQLNLIFSFVILLTSLIFVVAMNRVFTEFTEQQNAIQLSAYLTEVRQNADNPPTSTYNGYVIIENGIVVDTNNLDILNDNYTATQLASTMIIWPGTSKHEEIDGISYYYQIDRSRPGSNYIIVFTGEDYLKTVGSTFSTLMRVSFIALVLLGNIIILMWSKITVERVKRLQGEIQLLTKNSYKVPIEVEGNDEITDLARAIERMRQEIEYNEKTKQEMLQNISHDFKTPIAVIQSYAEAIKDGVSDKEEAKVIVKQADVLNQKVKQLLELNKLEYLKTVDTFEDVQIKEIITNIVNNQKYRTSLEFITDLDGSTYYGVRDNFYTAFSNIIDNAMRYARSKIVITLKQKKLTFYNDGEPISDKFIEQLFRPYEKGSNGQFGLGMSIVQKTCQHFNLQLKVDNLPDGVMFTIEPL